MTQVTFSHWLEDAKNVLLRATDGPQLVVASSMGGWVCYTLLYIFVGG